MILSLVLLFFLTAVISELTVAQEKTVTFYADPSGNPPDLPVRITHLTARVNFKPTENLIEGTAEFTFTWNRPAKDPIIFHAPDFKVSSVKIDRKEVKFLLSNAQLFIYVDSVFTDTGYWILDTASTIQHPASSIQHPASSIHHPPSSIQHPASSIHHPPSTIQHPPSSIQHPASSILITYSASPLNGNPYFIGWHPEETGKRKQIWAHRPHGWLPYMDGRITTDLYVTFDQAFKVFSNGERIGVTDNKNGTKTWHYAMKKDHPFFSTALIIGDYDYKQGKTSRGTPLEFWYYSDMPDRVATTYAHTEKMFDFFEKDLGFNYPYPVYREAPVIDYMYGAMETTTSTVFGDYMQITPRSWWQRNYVNVNAHELAHQWFGNCVAHFVNRDVWLTESFGTYYAKMFEKNIYGDDYWQNIRNDERQITLDAAKKNSFPVGGSQGGVQRIYQKGSLVIEMLRNVMGDPGYRAAVKLYLDKYSFGYAETNDFIRCAYEATGKPWNWFFDQWILRGGEPFWVVTDTVETDSTGAFFTIFNVRQAQEINELNGLFKMPLKFEVHYADGSMDAEIQWVEKEKTVVKIPNRNKKPIDFLLFDPGRAVLKKVSFNQPVGRLLAQAGKAENMIDRYDAWLSLRPLELTAKKDVLMKSFNRETFHLMKSEILRQLSDGKDETTVEIFRKALLDKDALVRKTALQLLKPIPVQLQPVVEKLLYDSSFANVELALEALCVSFPAKAGDYLLLTQDMEGWRGKNIRMKWLEISIATGNKDYLPEVINYCSPKFEFETRMNAFTLLKNMNYSDPETLKFAETAGKHWNNKLSAVAKEYLKTVKQ